MNLKHLKVEDSCVVILKGLAVRDNPMKKPLVEGERADSS